MLSYACVAEYYSEKDSYDYLGVLNEDLDSGATALQAFLGKSDDYHVTI